MSKEKEEKFTGMEGAFIPLIEAKAKTSRYRAKTPKTTKAFFFGKDKIKKILDQNGCMGIRVYYGTNPDSTPELIMVGADQNMNDMTDKILDRAFPCPTYCNLKEGGLDS